MAGCVTGSHENMQIAIFYASPPLLNDHHVRLGGSVKTANVRLQPGGGKPANYWPWVGLYGHFFAVVGPFWLISPLLAIFFPKFWHFFWTVFGCLLQFCAKPLLDNFGHLYVLWQRGGGIRRALILCLFRTFSAHLAF